MPCPSASSVLPEIQCAPMLQLPLPLASPHPSSALLLPISGIPVQLPHHQCFPWYQCLLSQALSCPQPQCAEHCPTVPGTPNVPRAVPAPEPLQCRPQPPTPASPAPASSPIRSCHCRLAPPPLCQSRPRATPGHVRGAVLRLRSAAAAVTVTGWQEGAGAGRGGGGAGTRIGTGTRTRITIGTRT